MSKIKTGLLLLILFLFLIPSAVADLVATVTPGYTFASGERPTTATLNLLANPTITISGTIGGTNAGLAAKSVNGAQLADSVVDDVTIQFDGSSPRALQVLTAGLAGPGLIGGTAGGPLTNNVDGVTIRITNDVVTLHTNLPLVYLACPSNYTTIGTGSGYLTNISLNSMAALLTNTPSLSGLISSGTNATYNSTNAFVSTNVSLSGATGGIMLNSPHGLGAAPKVVRAVVVCTTADLGYAVGDEVDVAALQGASGAQLYTQQAIAVGNSTNVVLVCRNTAGTYTLPQATDGTTASITASSWAFKVYAKP